MTARMPSQPAALLLACARHGIDRVDEAMLALLATRRLMSATAGRLKRRLQQPLRDAQREREVGQRMLGTAARLHVPADTATRLTALLIADARRQQQRHARFLPSPRTRPAMIDSVRTPPLSGHALLRLVPPPRRWRGLLKRVPEPLQAMAVQRGLSQVLARARIGHAMDAIAGRRLGIEVADLGLRWVMQWHDGHLQVVSAPAEASVRGSVTDLLLLASREEDADTLFFQRKLELTGDTELGLTVRNLLDRMPWETLPLGLRIVLQRSARLLRAAREAGRA